MLRRAILVVIGLLFVDAATFAVVAFTAFSRYHPPTVAMEPTLRFEESTWARATNTVRRGDVVILEVQRSADEFGRPKRTLLVVSRVVAVGGDTIEAVDGRVVLNGRPLAEPYLAETTQTYDLDRIEIPHGHVFYMGDNRQSSADSRAFGPVPAVAVKEQVRSIGAPPMQAVVAAPVVLGALLLGLGKRWRAAIPFRRSA